MTAGVIYYNTGLKCLARLITSIYSLRKHYEGAIAIISEGAESDEYCGPIAQALGCEFVPAKFDVPNGPQNTFLKKTLLHTVSPYDLNVFLDSDTIVTGSISPLFSWALEHEFVGTQFSNWKTTGKTIGKRIKNWERHYPHLMEKALAFGPALNAGCYAFKRDTAFLKVWYMMTLPGREIFLPEETSMQVILPNYKHYIAPQEFNCSCKFSDPRHVDVRIIHYHRNKHCREGLPFGGDIWIKHFERVRELKLAGIESWWDKYDITLSRYYGDKSEVDKLLPKPVPSIPHASKPFEITETPARYRPEDLTIVSAVSPNCLYALRANFPTWQAKAQLRGLPMIIFHHGFEDPENDLRFVLEVPTARLVHWTMPKYDSMRELMISAFILGAAREVQTEYYLKLDADAYFSGREDVLEEEHFKYDLCGHRWGVSRLKHLQDADKWADSHHAFSMTRPFLRDAERAMVVDDQVKYHHPRIISWICLHKMAFVREVAAMCGDRMPIPSHDTLLWYVANRFGRPWNGTKLNRGTGHGKRLNQFMDAHNKLAEQGYFIPEESWQQQKVKVNQA